MVLVHDVILDVLTLTLFDTLFLDMIIPEHFYVSFPATAFPSATDEVARLAHQEIWNL